MTISRSEMNCGNCVGIVRELCDEAFRQESQLIDILQVMDADEVRIAQEDPSVSAESLQKIEEAAQAESVHLFDYRAHELTNNLVGLGCELTEDEVKAKIIKE